MKVLKSSEARAQFQELIHEVFYTKKRILITKNNKPRVLVIPIPEEDQEVQNIISTLHDTKKEQ